MWRDYSVFDDAYMLSWLKLSAESNLSADSPIPSKCSLLEKCKSLEGFFSIVEKHAKANSKILLGFSEVMVLYKDFCIEQFTINLRKTVQTLLQINRVQKVLMCTVPPDTERLTYGYYVKALKSIN